ncbi:manganese ABC transporter [Klebsiella pneumoniae]|uniref:Manganese ABC transporter n=1 Tax=Klebsiella pneumoniae TaxID=573 RepID=A0A377WKC7_KLEPN|nr:manganese ABC transporter [Klebsiella pneumoniae]
MVICLVVTLAQRPGCLLIASPACLYCGDHRQCHQLSGCVASYYLDGVTGGIIVVAQTLIFLLVFHFAPGTWLTGEPPIGFSVKRTA